MTTASHSTWHEIQHQPDAWAEALNVVEDARPELEDFWQVASPDQVILTGCGSTYFLSVAASSLLQAQTGISCRAVPASELILHPEAVLASNGRLLLIAISRSGETSETVRAVSSFRSTQRGAILCVTNSIDRPLSRMGDVSLVIPAGQERSVVQTRSFASMHVAMSTLASVLSHDAALHTALGQLPKIGRRLIARYEDRAEAIGGNLWYDRIYCLGSGPRYGLACEASLKLKEMSLTHAEAFYAFEFRHGPMSMVTPTTLIIGLVSELHRAHEAKVLSEMRTLGAVIVAVAEDDNGIEADELFELASALPESARNILYMPVVHMIGYHRAIAKGLNPDQPTNLSSVVHLDW